MEDLYKVKDYIELFNKQSVRNKLPVNKRDINLYDSLGELAKTIEPFKESEEILSRSEIKDKNFVKEFKNFNLYIPRTYEDSCILGKGTEWCTATEKPLNGIKNIINLEENYLYSFLKQIQKKNTNFI
ncbi:MAG: hypothetical protein HPY57_14180 [Ignavibacteria bacterium]|nr:hypothetical protein [Ignavibacteria bacterium]